MASSCLGDRKQVQDARFDSHLTGIKKESFNWRTKTIAHDKGFPRKKNKFAMLKTSLSASLFSSLIVICVKIFKH